MRNLSDTNSGDTSWILSSCGLVLSMTLPGLALYYGGMVRSEFVLSTAMQSLSITCIITFAWLCVGYSLSFAPVSSADGDPFIGDATRMWLINMSPDTIHQLAPTIPESVFCIRQLTFAIVTPALMCGSFAYKMKFRAMLIFMTLWHICVYCPVAHASWHPAGFLYKLGVLDFAGGNVVHINAGVATFVLSYIVGKSTFGMERFEPHNILLTMVGMSMLWVGWYGFNAGSFSTADGRAGFAMLVTQIGSSSCALSWMCIEWNEKDYPTILGMMSGAVAGLVAITPAAGYVDQTGAFFIGLICGPFCYYGVRLKHRFGFDDALDAFGTHAIAGTVGGILTGFFARKEFAGSNGVFYGNPRQLAYQLAGISFAAAWSGVITFLLLMVIDRWIGLRLAPEDELNVSAHGGGVHRVDELEDTVHDERKNTSAGVVTVPISTLPRIEELE